MKASVFFILQSLSCLITKIVQLQMTDNPNTQGKQYLFSLVRLRPECKIQPTYVDFQPLFPSATPGASTVPVFNQDRCYFTSAFLLPSDKKAQAGRFESERSRFEHRVRQAISSTDSPKLEDLAPSSNYCQICREFFKNYQDHLQQKTHLLRWHHNEFNDDIRVLCNKIQKTENAEQSTGKHKAIRKKEKNVPHGYAIKGSPKTMVDNYPKRKNSCTEQEGSLNHTLTQQTFHL